MADLPGVVSYGTVTGTFVRAVIDGDDANDLPDALPITGSVTFTCSARKIIAGGKIIIPDPITANLDGSGSFTVKLIATDDTDLNPTGFTWAVSTSFGLDGFSMALPAGSTVDLSAAVPVGSSGGTLIVRGEKGDSGGTYTTAQYNQVIDDRLGGPASGLIDTGGLVVSAKIPTNLKTRTGTRPVGVAEVIINADDYGVTRNGTTDDTAAIDAVFAAAIAAAKSAQVFGATAVAYFRAGRYIDNGSRTITDRMVVRGDGPYNTIFYRKSGATGDWLTLTGAYSGFEGATLDGNRSGAPSAVDGIVLNAYRTYVANATVVKTAGNGITVGKTSAALGHRLTGLGVGQCVGYGILVTAASGSTDGMWSDLDVGQCGLSGVRISNGAQNVSNLHSWGNGLESATDNHGIYLDSASSVFLNYQGETNLGSGAYVAGSGSTSNQFVVPKLWGNMAAGLRIFAALQGCVVGGEIYRNGGGNTGGTGSTSYANILNDGGVDWTFTGTHCWEDSAAVGAGDYTGFGTGPTYPFPGRASGTFYATYGYAEINAADYCVLNGCKMRRDQHKTGSVLLVGNNDRVTEGGNDFGVQTAPTRTVTSSAVRAPAESDVIVVATNAAIATLLGGRLGRTVTIIFTSATPGTITAATASDINAATANVICLAGQSNYTPAQFAALTVRFDGTRWWETGRKT